MTDNDFMGFVPSTGGKYECLPVGSYDYVIHGIVGLGLRPHSFEGKELKPHAVIKIIFEIPDSLREDGMTELLSVKLPISTNEKSHFFKFCTVLLGASITNVAENMNRLCTATGLKNLLGKTGTLTVSDWKSGEGRSVDRAGFHPLHPKAPVPAATRECIFFNPFSPDIDVFKNNLTFYTRKDIMEALNADSFTDELKQAYQETLVEDAANKVQAQAKAGTIEEASPWATGESIQ